LLASLAASNVKELGLLVTRANMSRNSTHSKYGFEIKSNIKIPSSQFSVFDIQQGDLSIDLLHIGSYRAQAFTD